jgi:uncharacterized protein (DUF2147 family)
LRAAQSSVNLEAMLLRRRQVMKAALVALALPLLGSPAGAAPPSPLGYWTTISDDGKEKQAVVLIEGQGDQLSGKLVHIFNPAKRNDKCDKCDGAFQGKPIVGLRFMWGLKPDGSEWSGGSVLDPSTGKVYRCFIEPIEGGKRLKVRGYFGLSVLGRTQYWVRASGPTG